MMNFGDILTRLRDGYAGRFEPEGLRVLASLYWRTLLCAAALVIALSLKYGMWDLFGVLAGLSATSDTAGAPKPALTRAQLEAVVQGFKARQTHFDELSGSVGAISDPSR